MNIQDKNKTLFGLLIKSQRSGAIYLWMRNTDKTVIVGGESKERPIGLTAPIFTEETFGVDKDNKIVHLESLYHPENPPYIIVKEIHIKKLSVNIPECKEGEVLIWQKGKFHRINFKTRKSKLVKA